MGDLVQTLKVMNGNVLLIRKRLVATGKRASIQKIDYNALGYASLCTECDSNDSLLQQILYLFTLHKMPLYL